VGLEADVEDFAQITALITLAALLGVVARGLKQPLIIAYIACGIIAGPAVLGFIHGTDTLTLFSHIGVSLLLYMVGLGMSPHVIKEVGKVSTITGIGQIIFTSIFGFILCTMLGFGVVESAYVSIAITFSSTIIIMKLLTDRGDSETLYGKISIGFLIIQDLVAVFILMLISSAQTGGGIRELIIQSITHGGILLITMYLLSRYFLPKIAGSVARSQENLVAFSIGWCLISAFIFSSFGFSMEIGALLAGVALAGSIYRVEIMARMRALRDFFLIMFFILLGSQIQLGDVTADIIPIIILSIFVLVGNPLIVFFIMTALGHTSRNGFMAGLTVAQISEFSIILVTLGMRMGHLQERFISMITLIGIVTIIGSVYMIRYSDKIYPLLAPMLEKFQKTDRKQHRKYADKDIRIILIGHNRIGSEIIDRLNEKKSRFLVVDYNPQTIDQLRERGVDCIYGDVTDIGFLEEIPIDRAKLIISTIPDFETNELLISQIRKINKQGVVFLTSYDFKEALKLYSCGADYVVIPHFLSGVHLNNLLSRFHKGKLIRKAEGHVKHLEKKLQKPKNRRRKG
jgi:Kef-type K+ transport system membrane component KefB/Trk K+ transport system NAD-binding subunit